MRRPRKGERERRTFDETILKFFAITALASLTVVPLARSQNSRTIYLVRHADKISDERDAPLSDAGRKRAECLASTLKDSQIQGIFTSDLQRTQQTAAPLAQKLHLKPMAVPIRTPDDLVAAIRSSHAAKVLVVWHDATLPGILRALGAPEITPIGHAECDRFLYVRYPVPEANPSRDLQCCAITIACRTFSLWSYLCRKSDCARRKMTG